MDPTWIKRGAVGAAAFAACVFLLLPPTETKATWTNVNRVSSARQYAYAPAAEPEQGSYAASMPASEPEPVASARLERGEEPTDVATARESAIAESDRDYGDGYAWASENEVEDPRECRRLHGPQNEGCRDYVASLAPDMERDEGPF